MQKLTCAALQEGDPCVGMEGWMGGCREPKCIDSM